MAHLPLSLALAFLPALTAPSATTAPSAHSLTFHSVGPGGGGWIEAVTCDPRNPEVVYVGCDVGGFYISFDGGAHFESRNTGLRDFFVEQIAVSPRDSRLLLLATEGGIYRITDQGLSWQWIRAGFPDVQRYAFSSPISAICFDSSHPDVAYAGVGRQRSDSAGKGLIYRSADAGLTWRAVSAGQLPSDAIVTDLEVKPDDSRTVLAATSRGLFRSDDSGSTWHASNSGLPHTYVEELAFAPSAPSIVYLTLRTTARDAEVWNGGVYRSDDAGRTWQPRLTGLPDRVGKRNESSYMTSNDKEIVVDPRNPDVVYVGDRAWVTAGVKKSTDGGRHWSAATVHYGDGINMDLGWIRQWGPSVECLAISPAAPDRVFFGTSGHLFATSDAGRTWQQRYCRTFPDGRFAGAGLEVTCLNDVVPDPVRPARIYFCYFDIGLLISDDSGATFHRSFEGMKHDGNTFTVAVDPAAPATIWAATGEWGSNHGDVCRSDDSGATWHVVGDPTSGLPDGQTRYLTLDLRSPVAKRRLVVTINGHGVYESIDAGASWHSINGDLPFDAAQNPCGLLLDPADSRHLIFAATGSVAKSAGVYETRDSGATWHRLSRDLNVGDIQCLAADPRDPRTLYLGVRELYDRDVTPNVMRPGGVFKSRDGGATWRQVLDYHFVSSVAIGPGAIYVGTNDNPYHDDCAAEGVLKSADGGKTWVHENTGLTLPCVSCLRVDPRDPTRLYLGTGGNGAFLGTDTEAKR